jgi:spermidine synthase
MVAQLVLLREFISVFAGNELILGFVLGFWFLLTALGAEAGRRMRARSVVGLLVGLEIATGFLPLLQVVAIRLVRATLLPGVAPGPNLALWSSLGILLPGCFANGWLFAALVRHATETWGEERGRAYLVETIGLAFGGLAYSMWLSPRLGSIDLAVMVAIQNGLAAFLLAWSDGRRRIAVVSVAALALFCILVYGLRTDIRTLQPLYPGGRIVSQAQSPYGHLVVTEQAGQRTFFEQGIPLFSTQDTAAQEERVHFALAQRDRVSSVLLVGGAACRAAGETLKHAPSRIDCVEPDPVVLRALRAECPGDPRIHYIETDARRYLRRTATRYDAIILGLPSPDSIQLNRFFTREFFADVSTRLMPGGVVSMALPGSESYLSPSQKVLLSSVHAALQASFRHTLTIPGEKTILLASNDPLAANVPAILARRGIQVRYLTEGYQASRLAPDRLKEVGAIAAAPSRSNADFAPVSYSHALNLWLEKSGGNLLWPIVAFAALILGVGVLFLNNPTPSVTAAIATTGFAGISLEVLLMVAFQTLYGSLYLHLGLLFAAFMFGTAAGSFAGLKGWLGGGTRGLGLLDAGLSILSLVSVVAIGSLAASGAPAVAGPFVIAMILAAAGFIVGAQFPLAARMRGEESATFYYAADLLGACLGAFATAALLLPALGLAGIGALLAVLKLGSLLGLWLAPPERVIAPAQAGRSAPAAWAAIVLFVLCGILIVSESTQMSIYSFSLSSGYLFAVVAAIFLFLWATWCRASGDDPRAPGDAPRRFPHWRTMTQAGNYLLFGLVAFFPIFRCYFKVPYLFCHVCPRQCIFGYVRPYVVSGALLANLGHYPFCQRVCPLGTLFDAVGPRTQPGRRLQRVLWGLRLAIMVLVALLYFPMDASSKVTASGIGALYTFLFRNDYSVGVWAIVVSFGFMLLGWKIKRCFCLALCPISAASDLATRLIRNLPVDAKNNQPATEGGVHG